jgi:MFS family permease
MHTYTLTHSHSGFGILVIFIPNILTELFDGDETKAGFMISLVDGVGALIAFFALPAMGTWSDRVGRKVGTHTHTHTYIYI